MLMLLTSQVADQMAGRLSDLMFLEKAFLIFGIIYFVFQILDTVKYWFHD